MNLMQHHSESQKRNIEKKNSGIKEYVLHVSLKQAKVINVVPRKNSVYSFDKGMQAALG